MQGQATRLLFAACAALLLAGPAMAQQPQCRPGVVPDQSAGCTPGDTASTDEDEVCSRTAEGTYSQRHRLSQTPAVKQQVLSRYGVPWSARAHYEDDHDVPLCLGGSDSVTNRWPQPRDGEWSSALKDKLEALACHKVCVTHEVMLQDAQAWFRAPADWREAYCREIGGTPCPSLVGKAPLMRFPTNGVPN